MDVVVALGVVVVTDVFLEGWFVITEVDDSDEETTTATGREVTDVPVIEPIALLL